MAQLREAGHKGSPDPATKSRPKQSLDRQGGRGEVQTEMDVVSWGKSKEAWRRQN